MKTLFLMICLLLSAALGFSQLPEALQNFRTIDGTIIQTGQYMYTAKDHLGTPDEIIFVTVAEGYGNEIWIYEYSNGIYYLSISGGKIVRIEYTRK